MKIKTSELQGATLDWAVSKCEIPNDVRDNRQRFWIHPNNPKLICRQTYNHEDNPKGYELCCYSTSWSQAGPIIEREGINVFIDDAESTWHWGAGIYLKEKYYGFGDTPLVAAMRCYVASKLGDEVEVPEELK